MQQTSKVKQDGWRELCKYVMNSFGEGGCCKLHGYPERICEIHSRSLEACAELIYCRRGCAVAWERR